MKRIFFYAITAVLCLASLTHCGGDDNSGSSPAASQTKLDACALLTKADVTTAIGGTVSDPARGIADNQNDPTYAAVSECVYTSSPSGVKADLLTRVSNTSVNTPDQIAKIKAQLAQTTNSTPQDVTGIGDTAFAVSSGPNFARATQLNIFIGEKIHMVVSVMNMTDDAAALEKAKSLASTIISRL